MSDPGIAANSLGYRASGGGDQARKCGRLVSFRGIAARRMRSAGLFELTSQMLKIQIVLASIFDDFGVWSENGVFNHRLRLRIDLRVIDRDLNLHVTEVRSPKMFRDM